MCLAGCDCDVLDDVLGGAASREVVDWLVDPLQNWSNCSGAGRALGEFIGDIAGIQIGKDKYVGWSEFTCLSCLRLENLWQNRRVELNLASDS